VASVEHGSAGPVGGSVPRLRRTVGADEAGMTLVELVVAMMLLGVILSAAAAALINFAGATHNNERRVQATAVMNGLHENLQGVPWHDAGIFEDEIDRLAPVGVTNGSPPTFEGREVVTIPPPDEDCPVDEPDCVRAPTVPRANYTIPNASETSPDGREYEIFQVVTWDGTGGAEVKRFTTIVEWEVRGRTVTERFDSERAASAGEAGDPTLPRVIQFQLGPSPMELVDEVDGTGKDLNAKDITVAVRFSEGVDSATLHYYTVNDKATQASGQMLLKKQELPLQQQITDPNDASLGVFFVGTIPELAHRWPNGPRPFRVEGILSGSSFWGSGTMSFYGGTVLPHDDDGELLDDEYDETDEGAGEVAAPEEDVAITEVTVHGKPMCIHHNHGFTHDLKIRAHITGLRPTDHLVTATHTAGSSAVGTLEPQAPDTFSSSGEWFELVLPAGQHHGFKEGDKTQFSIIARRPESDGMSDGPILTETVDFLKHNAC
jgi:prepilin-type N-terminal cleavage/methylation domain-containing protein